MTEVAKKLTAQQIQTWLRANTADTSVDNLVVDAMLEALESKISEAAFVAFCGELEAAL